MDGTSLYVAFATLKALPAHLPEVKRAVEAVPRDVRHPSYTVRSFARKGIRGADRRVMIVYRTRASEDEALATLEHLIRLIPPKISVRAALHFTDGTEQPVSTATPASDRSLLE